MWCWWSSYRWAPELESVCAWGLPVVFVRVLVCVECEYGCFPPSTSITTPLIVGSSLYSNTLVVSIPASLISVVLTLLPSFSTSQPLVLLLHTCLPTLPTTFVYPSPLLPFLPSSSPILNTNVLTLSSLPSNSLFPYNVPVLLFLLLFAKPSSTLADVPIA